MHRMREIERLSWKQVQTKARMEKRQTYQNIAWASTSFWGCVREGTFKKETSRKIGRDSAMASRIRCHGPWPRKGHQLCRQLWTGAHGESRWDTRLWSALLWSVPLPPLDAAAWMKTVLGKSIWLQIRYVENRSKNLPVGLRNQKATTWFIRPGARSLPLIIMRSFWLVTSQLHVLFQDSLVSTLFARM